MENGGIIPANYTSSHNHASVKKKRCISNRIVTFQVFIIFHWTMMGWEEEYLVGGFNPFEKY